MRTVDRIELIGKLKSAVLTRYDLPNARYLLTELEIDMPAARSGTRNLSALLDDTLRSAQSSDLRKLAEELSVTIPGTGKDAPELPANWVNDTNFKVFVSHVSEHKTRALRLRDCLLKHRISAFVAHEDIHPTETWQIQIERALDTMDAFIALHTEGFNESNWTQQEIGYALGRKVKVLSVKMDEKPTGFLSKHQALLRGTRKAEDVAREIDDLLAKDPLTAARLEKAKRLNPIDVDDDDF